MDTLVSSAQNVLDWIQIPKYIFAAIMLAIAGFCWMGLGQKGTQIAKALCISVLVGLVLIGGAQELVDSYSSNIEF